MSQRLPSFLPALLVCLPLLATACDTAPASEDPQDAEDASFLVGGKADGGSAAPDVAAGVIALANGASFEVLDDSDEVGLDRRAAAGIVQARAGADGIDGTGDDVPFETLAQLDAVPWVGPSAFARMQTYALANGFVADVAEPPTGLPRCEGGFSPAQIQAVSRDGWVEFALATFERHCDENDGQTECSAWAEVELRNPDPSHFNPNLEGHTLEIEAQDGLISVRGGHSIQWFEGSLEVGDDETVLEMELGYNIYECYPSGHCYSRDRYWATLSGPVTADCISVSQVERVDEMVFAPGVESYTERALVAFSE